jgi:Cupin-like domain
MDLHARIAAGAAAQVLSPRGVEQLRAVYPHRIGVLEHSLADHPLLSREMLAMAAERMNPAHVECRAADGNNGGEFAHASRIGDSAAETIRHIDQAGRWVMLRFAEQLPEYGELIAALQAQMEPVMRPTTGPALKAVAFIFISSPGTLTPYHFDPEYNILFQVAGRKRFVTFPDAEPWLPIAPQEQFHRLEENLLPWEESYRSGETVHRLAPGDALYVPYKVPHWVEVDDETSISISLTWCTAGSIEQDLAWRCNDWLRARGFAPRPPVALPRRPLLKARTMGLLQRFGLD